MERRPDRILRTVVAHDAEDLAARVAAAFRDLVRAAGGKNLNVALAGGDTPRGVYQHLGSAPMAREVDWSRVVFFFGDERAVPPDHPDSNFGMAWRALLSRVPARAHSMAAERGEAGAYARLLETSLPAGSDGVPVLDLVLLGVGTDGHTASLFPGTPAVEETEKLVVMNEVPGRGMRMTFTYLLLNAARRVWILATGEAKRDIVARCHEALRTGRTDPSWPVTRAAPLHGELVWWLDAAAAGGLPRGELTTE